MIRQFLTPADDATFIAWMKEHCDQGFYLNEQTPGTIRRGHGTVLLHKVGCSHLGFGERGVSTSYAKVAAESPEELLAWAQEHSLALQICSSCRRTWDASSLEQRLADTSEASLDEETLISEYVSALKHVEAAITGTHGAMLKTHAEAPDTSLSPESEIILDVATDREAAAVVRIGQELFRTQLIDYWQACAVTGVQTLEALRASHIKPWARATNQERLDPFNGLLLVGTLDLLFDAGLISFDDRGAILISPRLAPEERARLQLHEQLRLRKIAAAHQPYLAFHREHVYR